MTSIQLFWFILGTSWAIIEAFIAVNTRVGIISQEQNPYHSERLIWYVIVVALLGALFIKRLHLVPLPIDVIARHSLAILLFAGGLVVRCYAVLTLRQFFSTRVTIQHQHQLIEQGLYRWLRHPAYSGLLLSFAGAGIAMGDGLALLVLLLPVAYVMVQRIDIEETELQAHFGQAYAEYCQRTDKLIPGVY